MFFFNQMVTCSKSNKMSIIGRGRNGNRPGWKITHLNRDGKFHAKALINDISKLKSWWQWQWEKMKMYNGWFWKTRFIVGHVLSQTIDQSKFKALVSNPSNSHVVHSRYKIKIPCATDVSVAQLVSQALQFICIEVVIVPQNVIVARPVKRWWKWVFHRKHKMPYIPYLLVPWIPWWEHK